MQVEEPAHTVTAAEQFEALADRAAVQFPERLDIQAAACALLGSWALKNRALIAAALRGGEDGWVSVPREPTEAMLHNGASTFDHPSVYMGGPSENGKRYSQRIYRAMIAAAPLPPSPGAAGE